MPLSPEAFAAFRRELEADYPPLFADAAFLLQRLREGEAPLGLSAGSSPRMAPFALEKLALRGQARRPHAPPADVLASFFPGRPDYRDLMAPALAELRRRGQRVVVALPPRRELQGLDFGGAPRMALEPFAGPARYVAARAAYTRLHPDERRFAQRFGLAGDARAHLSIVLQASCWQHELFYAALRATGARAVFGLHFTLHPGFLGAVRRRRAETGAPSVTLIQHGVFSHAWETHDFFGADRVLLWGAAAAEELAAFPGATPPVTLVGHPKLDAMRRAAAARAHSTGAPRVLVLGTNGVEAREREAIVLAAEALPETATRQVRFRPHPREPRTTYEALIDRGVLRPGQIEADGDVYDAVLAADLVLGTQTTLLPEAVALGVPAAQLLPERFEVDWARRGLANASSREPCKTWSSASSTRRGRRTRARGGAALRLLHAGGAEGRPSGSPAFSMRSAAAPTPRASTTTTSAWGCRHHDGRWVAHHRPSHNAHAPRGAPSPRPRSAPRWTNHPPPRRRGESPQEDP